MALAKEAPVNPFECGPREAVPVPVARAAHAVPAGPSSEAGDDAALKNAAATAREREASREARHTQTAEL